MLKGGVIMDVTDAKQAKIAEDVKVGEANLKDGLLTIECERIVPDFKKKKLIQIK